MLIQTTRFGKLAVEPSKILFFPNAFLGLPGSQHYVLLDAGVNSPFQWLQSCDEPEVALVVADPRVFFPDYAVQIPAEEIQELEVSAEDELMRLVVLVVPANPRQITANLLAPVVINLGNNRARQVILTDARYSTRQYIFPQESLENQTPESPEPKARAKPNLSSVAGGLG